MPGAGGLASANRLYNVSERDGSILSKLERAVPQLAVQGNPNANFDPQKFTWLGSLSSYANDAYLMTVMADNPIKSVEELQKPGGKPLTLGGDNSASSNLIFALLAKEVLGLNVNLVRGYTGAAPMFLAMQRGELDGQIVGFSSIRTGQRALWDKHAFRPLMQFGRTKRLADFPDIPTGRELAKDANALALIDFAELPFFMSLPFAAPPGIPADRAKALQTAFMEMCGDPQFLAEAQKLGIEMSPIDSEEILRQLRHMAATPKEVITRYTGLVQPEKK
jgi:tripartite-type tricarboxylate transporter receptor subunit TctC